MTSSLDLRCSFFENLRRPLTPPVIFNSGVSVLAVEVTDDRQWDKELILCHCNNHQV